MNLVAHGLPYGIGVRFAAAVQQFRELSFPFHVAVTMLEHGEWLAARAPHERVSPMLDEARATFERLHARPWIERLARVASRHRHAGRSAGSVFRQRNGADTPIAIQPARA